MCLPLSSPPALRPPFPSRLRSPSPPQRLFAIPTALAVLFPPPGGAAAADPAEAAAASASAASSAVMKVMYALLEVGRCPVD